MPRTPDISLRHIPDLSDTSVFPDFSESSFQIPATASSASEFLLADDSLDFLGGGNDSMATPVHPTQTRDQPPLTLDELTPISRRTATVRSSLRPRLQVPSPLKPRVIKELANALEDTISPLQSRNASFQIPTETNTEDLLLADDADFLHGDDITLQDNLTLSSHPPLTLSQSDPPSPVIPGLTSSPSSSSASLLGTSQVLCDIASSRDRDPPSPSATNNPKSDSNHSMMEPPLADSSTQSQLVVDAQPSSSARIRVGVVPRRRKISVPQRNVNTTATKLTQNRKRTVIGGGITKSGKVKLPASSLIRKTTSAVKLTGSKCGGHGVTHIGGPSAVKLKNSSNTDDDKVSTGAGSSLAATLLTYGQHLMSSTVPDNSQGTKMTISLNALDVSSISAANSVDATGNQSAHDNTDRDCSLTISQLSPRKFDQPSPTTADGLIHKEKDKISRPTDPPPPIRSSAKRPMSAVSEPTFVPVKKGKLARSTVALGPRLPKGSSVRSNTLRSSRTKNSASTKGVVDPSSHSREQGYKSRVASGPASSSPWIPERTASSSSAGRSGDSKRAQTEGFPKAETRRRLHHSQDEGLDHQPGRMLIFDKPSVPLPPAKPTKPIEFHFQSDARIEVRRIELEEKLRASQRETKPRAPLPVPDFKALHAAQEAELIARKEQIEPVLPGDIQFTTEARALEREKYEQARRAREQEIERQMEERRRLREQEEEQEIRELRKRAVPKAREVPEWYANAPKKMGDTKT